MTDSTPDTDTDPEADDDAPIRGEVRLVDHRRVAHGLYLRKREGLGVDEELLRDLRAFLLVLPEGAVFTHVTAARLLGWQLPRLPEQIPVFAAVRTKDNRPRRPGLICSRLVREPQPTDVMGIPVDAPEEIMLRAARDLGSLDLSIMLDSARRLGHIDDDRMDTILASKRPGVRVLAAAWALSHAKAESAGESVLRVFHTVIGVRVTPQVDLYSEDGRHLGRADLLVDGTPNVHEYDGEHHRSKKQQATDLRRERGWTGTSYVRRGYVLDDLVNHPLVLMHEIDRALGRPHSLARLARWRRMIDNSMYSESGRARVMNRWRRQTTLVDWSATA